MKTILHFIDSGGIYGAENVIINISREMLNDYSYTPVIGCIVKHRDERVGLYEKAKAYEIKAEKIIINNKRFFIDIFRAAIILRKKGIDLIHSHGYKPSVIGSLISLLTGIPVIATCHLWFFGGKRPLKQKIMTRLELFCYRFFSNIISVSLPIKSFLIKSGVKKDKITVIENGIFINDFIQRKDILFAQKLKKSIGVKKDELVILNVGRLTEQKAQKNLIIAGKELKQRNIKAQFIIIGDGELRIELQKLIEENNVNDKVKLLGFKENVSEYLGIADAFILTSYDEGLPISMLEAMANRKVLIVTPVGDIPNLVEDGYNGIIIAVDDVASIVAAVEKIIQNPKMRLDMTERAFKKLESKYSSKKMYLSYSKIYSNY